MCVYSGINNTLIEKILYNIRVFNHHKFIYFFNVLLAAFRKRFFTRTFTIHSVY